METLVSNTISLIILIGVLVFAWVYLKNKLIDNNPESSRLKATEQVLRESQQTEEFVKKLELNKKREEFRKRQLEYEDLRRKYEEAIKRDSDFNKPTQ